MGLSAEFWGPWLATASHPGGSQRAFENRCLQSCRSHPGGEGGRYRGQSDSPSIMGKSPETKHGTHENEAGHPQLRKTMSRGGTIRARPQCNLIGPLGMFRRCRQVRA